MKQMIDMRPYLSNKGSNHVSLMPVQESRRDFGDWAIAVLEAAVTLGIAVGFFFVVAAFLTSL